MWGTDTIWTRAVDIGPIGCIMWGTDTIWTRAVDIGSLLTPLDASRGVPILFGRGLWT